MITICRIDKDRDFPISDLCALLQDAVDNGASVGFLAPLAEETALRYWQDVSAADDSLIVWVAVQEGRVVGSVQLSLCGKENGRHRAEVQKLFVLSECRRQGIARQLMQAAEAFARADGRTLLVLDTQAGSPAEAFYQSLSWQRAGEIPDYASSPYGGLHATALYYKYL